ncbi:MAG: TolC family protein [Azoarcus sp.]|jgi:outer membrane protein TolC|nr:TolC family protein [Azoarcus sp.]
MIERYLPRAACCLALLLTAVPTLAASGFDPARPTMPGEPVSLAGKIVALSLKDAIFIGLGGNGSIRNAYRERLAQKAELKAAENRFSPKFSINSRHVTSQNPNDSTSQTEFSPTATLQSEYGTQLSLSWNNKVTQGGHTGYSRNDGTSFTVTQPLLRGAKREVVTAPVRLARLGDQINRLNLKATVSDTVTQIIIAYNDLLRLQERLRLAGQALMRSRQELRDIAHLIAAGYWRDYDFVQIEAEAAHQELSLEEATNQLEAGHRRLSHLLGLNPETKIRATDPLEASPVKTRLAQALADARARQPAYLIQTIASEQAAIRLAVARDQQQWDVSLVGGGSQAREYFTGANGRQTSENRENHAGIKIDIPFGDVSRRQTEVRARVEAKTQNDRLIEAQRALERDIGDALRDLDTHWRKYEAARRAFDLSRRKLEIEREKLQSGLSGSTRILACESDLRDAEIARLDALFAYRNAQAALDRARGTTLEHWEIALNDD